MGANQNMELQQKSSFKSKFICIELGGFQSRGLFLLLSPDFFKGFN